MGKQDKWDKVINYLKTSKLTEEKKNYVENFIRMVQFYYDPMEIQKKYFKIQNIFTVYIIFQETTKLKTNRSKNNVRYLSH